MDLPVFFVFDGTNAYTTNTIDEETITWEGVVKPKGYGSRIRVISTFDHLDPHQYTTRLDKSNFPVYKSNLQKCVRRQLSDAAVRTAYAMLSADEPDFLRRLPIVMIEDVLPHPSIIMLVWWMMATTKGYKLSDDDVSMVLGIVYCLCNIPIYQVYNSFCKPLATEIQWNHLPQTQKDVIWALEFRKAYGGMYCDVDMIKYLQTVWIKRMENPKNWGWKYINGILVEPLDLSSIGECDKYDLLLESIDQHCFSWIPRKLHETYPQHTEYEIKGAIWFYRSRLNLRRLCSGSKPIKYVTQLELVYEDIKVSLEKLCTWIFEKLIT